MRLRSLDLKLLAIATLLAVLPSSILAESPQGQIPSIPPIELVRKTVENEMQSSDDHAKFMFRDRKQTPHGSQTKLIVETKEGTAGLVIANDDKPLTPDQEKSELARVERFVQNPDELKHKQKQEKEDDERVSRIMHALPDAFLYEYDGTQIGRKGLGKPGHELIGLKFRPNPDYDPPSHVEQVLTGMAGTILIDAKEDRIAEIDGTLVKEVSFGWGIFGHLDPGGHFLVDQADIGGGNWEITCMDLSFTGKILLFKSLNIKSNEVSSDFQLVPPNLTFAEGLELLKKEEARLLPESHEHEAGLGGIRRGGD
jgi:hypothetical protein